MLLSFSIPPLSPVVTRCSPCHLTAFALLLLLPLLLWGPNYSFHYLSSVIDSEDRKFSGAHLFRPILPLTPSPPRLMNNLSLFRCLVHPRVSHLFNTSPTLLGGNSTPFPKLPHPPLLMPECEYEIIQIFRKSIPN